ncbi:MAG: hypothetical protein CMK89_05820 [Pseudomonadales bacterium]|nr:hypothetical protein [Pseudomonadales bacterium]
MLFDGVRLLKGLPQQQQEYCASQFDDYINKSLTPLLLDVAVLVNWCVVVLIFLLLISSGGNENVIRKLMLYIALVSCFYLAMRVSGLRSHSPYNVYLFFVMLCCWSLWLYVDSNGKQEHLYSLVFTLAFMGGVTLSLKHTMMLWLVYFVVIGTAAFIMESRKGGGVEISGMLGQGWILFCFIASLVTALVARILFRNMFAVRYLLEQRNGLLEETMKNLKEKERQLALHQKHQALSYMAAGLLHEILNPVNNSIQALSFAHSLNSDQALKEPLDDALENQNRIACIIQDLRAYISEKPAREKADSNVHDQLNKAMLICRNELAQIDVRLSGDSSRVVYGYPGELAQLYINIILNAASAITKKFDGKTGGALSIRWQQDAGMLKLSFLDNGIGMDSSLLPSIEDPFVGTGSPQHLGLGLSICRTIVNHHDGQINFFSELTEWTRVEVLLPAGQQT